MVEAEDFFVNIFLLDKNDDIWDERNWIKANPYLASSEKGLETLRQDAKTAKDIGGSDLRDFITNILNKRARDEDTQFIDLDDCKSIAEGMAESVDKMRTELLEDCDELGISVNDLK